MVAAVVTETAIGVSCSVLSRLVAVTMMSWPASAWSVAAWVPAAGAGAASAAAGAASGAGAGGAGVVCARAGEQASRAIAVAPSKLIFVIRLFPSDIAAGLSPAWLVCRLLLGI